MSTYYQISTGGGCKALAIDLPEGVYAWLTNADGTDVPPEKGPVLVEVYHPNGVSLMSTRFKKIGEAKAFLAEASESLKK